MKMLFSNLHIPWYKRHACNTIDTKKSKSVLQLPKSYKFDTRLWCWYAYWVRKMLVTQLRILAHSALSIGVEDDTIEEYSD